MIRLGRAKLTASATALLAAGGMDAEKAEVAAEVLVEADMIGHATHGLGLLPMYLQALASGELAAGRERFPEPWAVTALGEPSDDPLDVTGQAGTLMPLGGMLKGYKGCGTALSIEALSEGVPLDGAVAARLKAEAARLGVTWSS